MAPPLIRKALPNLQGKQKFKELEPGPYCSSRGREGDKGDGRAPLSPCPCPWVPLASAPPHPTHTDAAVAEPIAGPAKALADEAHAM